MLVCHSEKARSNLHLPFDKATVRKCPDKCQVKVIPCCCCWPPEVNTIAHLSNANEGVGYYIKFGTLCKIMAGELYHLFTDWIEEIFLL